MSGTVSSTIVVGVDGSLESAAASQWAAAEARRRHAHLLFLSADPRIPPSFPGCPAGREGRPWARRHPWAG